MRIPPTKTAIITLSPQGVHVAQTLATVLRPCHVYVHTEARTGCHASASFCRSMPMPRPFTSVLDLTAQLFSRYRNLIYIMPTGVVTRAIAPHLVHKKRDPAVVAVDVGGRWAVALLSGHEGGANALALTVANLLAAEPVITTTTETVKDLIVGVGCRRGTPAPALIRAIRQSLKKIHTPLARVRLLATADLKAREPGLLAAARTLQLPLRIISSEEIRQSPLPIVPSAFVQSKVNLPAVAEPAALLAGRRTTLLLPKTIYPGITVAIAQERCPSLASALETPSTARTAPKLRSRKRR